MATKKSDQISKLLSSIELRTELPEPLPERSLLEHALYAVLLRYMAPAKAKTALNGLAKHYPDWNELRVSQAQEIADAMAPRSKAKSRIASHLAPARGLKDFLLQVFQETHGLDFENLRTEPAGGVKQLAAVPLVGNEIATYLSWVAEDGALPVSGGIIRVLDRMGVMTRTSSMKKARAALEPLVSKSDYLRFGMSLGMVADRWCDSRKPTCWDCSLKADCPMGKKVVKDWEVQQVRLAAQREKDEARAEATRIKEEERIARETARERKRLEREAEKKRKHLDKERVASKKRVEEAAKKKAAVAAKKQAEASKKKAVVAAKKKAAAAGKKKAAADTKRKADAAKKAAAKKKATPKKKVAKKKAPAKKPAAKKTVTKKSSKQSSKQSSKKVAKKASKKKPAAKKPAAKKAAAKKAAKKKTAKKTAKNARRR